MLPLLSPLAINTFNTFSAVSNIPFIAYPRKNLKGKLIFSWEIGSDNVSKKQSWDLKRLLPSIQPMSHDIILSNLYAWEHASRRILNILLTNMKKLKIHEACECRTVKQQYSSFNSCEFKDVNMTKLKE